MLQKHRFIYKAVAEAIDAFGKKHYIHARAHFAHVIGYRGPNADIQLSSILNFTTYNPANPKRMNVDQLATILYEIDDEGRELILGSIVNEYGYFLSKTPEAKEEASSPMDVLYMSLKIDGVHGDLAKTLEKALEDGILTDEEKEQIKKAAFEVRKALRALEEALK